MTNDEIEAELRHLSTREDLALLRAEMHKEFGDFRAEMQREFGNFRTGIQEQFGGFVAGMQKQFSGLITTLWITQLSTITIVLIGVGLLIHFKL